jgi:hypothetical protein
MLSYQLFRIAKRLNSGELLLLRAIFDALMQNKYTSNSIRLSDWAQNIAKLQGHNLAALVMRDERRLVEEQLISGYRDATVMPLNQIVDDTNARLTDLGAAFCKNIQTYRIETRPDPA